MVRDLADDLAADGHDATVLTGWPSHSQGPLLPVLSAVTPRSHGPHARIDTLDG